MTMWHQSPAAQAILSSLTEQDLRIMPTNFMSTSVFRWASCTEHGDKVFSALADMYSDANKASPLAAVWLDITNAESVRDAALTQLMNDVPTVAAALATRFGSPNRFAGYDALDATRRFRAGFADDLGRVA